MIKTYPDRSIKKLQYGKAFLVVVLGCFLSLKFSYYFSLLGLLLPFILMFEIGVQIDHEKRLYRTYEKRFKKLKGEWSKLNVFSSIVVKRMDGKRRMYHSKSGTHRTDANEIFDVYLMDQTHRKSLFVKTYKTVKESAVFAQKLSEDLQFPIEKYNPKRGPRRR